MVVSYALHCDRCAICNLSAAIFCYRMSLTLKSTGRGSLLAQISWCSPWSRPLMFGSAENERPALTNREIIFEEEFQPTWSQSTNVTNGQRTDRQTTYDRKTALCAPVHRAVKMQTCRPTQISAKRLTALLILVTQWITMSLCSWLILIYYKPSLPPCSFCRPDIVRVALLASWLRSTPGPGRRDLLHSWRQRRRWTSLFYQWLLCWHHSETRSEFGFWLSVQQTTDMTLSEWNLQNSIDTCREKHIMTW